MTKDEQERLDAEQQEMALAACTRVYVWMLGTDLEIPPQVSYDIGIIIGRMRMLEDYKNAKR
jgi:hypothetical protein